MPSDTKPKVSARESKFDRFGSQETKKLMEEEVKLDANIRQEIDKLKIKSQKPAMLQQAALKIEQTTANHAR